MPAELIRLSKLMAQRGMCSRREADAFIAQGLVLVDGVAVTTLGTKVYEDQVVTLADAAARKQESLVTILLNKPVGYVSGQPEKGYIPAVTLIRPDTQAPDTEGPPFSPQHLRGLAPCGRLDIDSKGLLVFTQDGRLAKQLTSENSSLGKEYLVRVDGEVSRDALNLLRHGLSLDEKPLKPAIVEMLSDRHMRMVLSEGKRRQIRRMCDQVQLPVIGLKRVRIGNVRLGDLPEGNWRYLRPGETFG